MQLQEAWQALNGSHLQAAPAMSRTRSAQKRRHTAGLGAALCRSQGRPQQVTRQPSARPLHMGCHQQQQRVVGAWQWSLGHCTQVLAGVTDCCMQETLAFLFTLHQLSQSCHVGCCAQDVCHGIACRAEQVSRSHVSPVQSGLSPYGSVCYLQWPLW